MVVGEDHGVDVRGVDADPLEHDVRGLPVADAVPLGQLGAELDVVVARVDDREVPLALDHRVAVRGDQRAVVPLPVRQDRARELDDPRVLDDPDRIVGHVSSFARGGHRSTRSRARTRTG